MLTTSRGQVSLENRKAVRPRFDEELGLEEHISEPEITNTRKSFYSTDAFNTGVEEEYSASDIAAKLFGNTKQDEGIADSHELSDLDLVPSRRTTEYANPKNIEKNIYGSSAREVVTYTSSLQKTRTKVAVATYVAVVLALAIAIIFVATAVSGTYATANLMEKTLVEKVQEIETLKEGLSVVDEAGIIAAAQSIGYSLANTNNTVSVNVPQMRQAQTFVIESNWFDQLCDGISKLFGGN